MRHNLRLLRRPGSFHPADDACFESLALFQQFVRALRVHIPTIEMPWRSPAPVPARATRDFSFSRTVSTSWFPPTMLASELGGTLFGTVFFFAAAFALIATLAFATGFFFALAASFALCATFFEVAAFGDFFTFFGAAFFLAISGV